MSDDTSLPAVSGPDAAIEAADRPSGKSREEAGNLPDVNDAAPQAEAAARQDCDADDAHRYGCCILDKINAFRSGRGLSTIAWDPAIATMAFWYADLMAQKGSVSHGLDGLAVGERLDAWNIPHSASGENVAGNTQSDLQKSCEQIFTQWHNSPSHYSLMVAPKWETGAVGGSSAGGWRYAVLNVVQR